jgi:PAS domain S-box-containing protein
MRSNFLNVFLGLIVFSLSPLASCHYDFPKRISPEAVKGVLDLTDWDFERDGPVNLSGKYEFYWNQHLEPSDFSKESPPEKTGFIKVPGYWTNYKMEGKKLPSSGYATYRLSILLNDQKDPLALKFLDIGTAFTAFLNGKRLCSVGQVGKDRETTVPQFFPQFVDFGAKTTQIELILQVSNFHHRRGGVSSVVKVGRKKEIIEIREKKLGFDLFLFGSIFIMALYHLGLFSHTKKDRSPLYFSIFCFLLSLRLLTTGERYLIHLFPNTGWELMIKLEYLSFYLAVPAFVLFMRSFFREFSKRFPSVIIAISFAFSVIVLFTPARIFSHTLPLYQIITLIVFLYGLYVLIVASIQKRDGAFVFLLGFIILCLAVINDIMYVEHIIQTGYFAPFGLFVFIFSLGFLHSLRFSKAFTTVEMQHLELRDTFQAYKKEIKDHVQTEDALRESEEKYRTILQSIEEGYYEVDLTGNITYFNDSLSKILGYPKDELMGMNNRAYTSEKTAQRMYHTFNEVYHTGKTAKAFDWETIRKDGTTTYLEISVTLMHDSEGNPIGFRGIARDITERKQAEEQARVHQKQLMQADKMVALGTLVSGVAHEINNPNNFVMLNAPLLMEAWENAMPILEEYYKENGDFILGGMKYTEMRENIPKLFSGMLGGANRIKQIVDDLKNYIKKDTADLTQSVDINAVLKSAISLVSNMIKKSTNHFLVTYGMNLPMLRGNFQRLEQVMINLIQNACQALLNTEKGISISTSFDKKMNNIIIRIEDEGTGIPPETLPHITDPFFTTRQGSEGVGLGLSISSTIVEEHGGTMRFISEVGRGTTAEIVFPADRNNNSYKERTE